jgi:hypothetical protein
MRRALLLGLLLVTGLPPALAETGGAEPATLNIEPDWRVLAANDDMEGRTNSLSRKSSAPPTDGDMFTANKVHEYLGLGALGMAALAILAPKPEDDEDGGIHHDLAVGATVLGAAAVGTGLAFHWDDIDLSNGFSDPDNLHLALATLAELGFAAAVAAAPDSGHAALGALGAVSMVAAIKVEW